ncbi:hypothetical protein AB0F25_19770 [Streptomyces wedmorensis]|uniref:hypothetical protein n=1 Tax=Streptomyces wedmorensis TaxID=43759 RepID=UPI003420FE4D
MNTWTSWTLLVAGAVFLLLPGLAVLAGRRPGSLNRAEGPVPLLGASAVALYGLVLADEVPRLVGARRAGSGRPARTQGSGSWPWRWRS